MTMPDLDEQPNLEGLPGLVKLWQDGGRDDAPGELRQKITALIVPSPPSGQEDRLAAALDRADPHDSDLVDTLRAALAALPFTDELTTLPTNPRDARLARQGTDSARPAGGTLRRGRRREIAPSAATCGGRDHGYGANHRV